MRLLILTFVCICFLTTLVASANNYRYSTISWETSYDCTTCSENATTVCIAFSGRVGVLGDEAAISDITGNTLSFNMNDGNTVSTVAYVAEKQFDFQQRIYTIYNFEFNYCYDYDDISEEGFYVNSDICYRSPATNMAQNNRCSRIECDGVIDIEIYYQNSIQASVSVPVVIPAGVSTYTIPHVASTTNPMPVQCSFQRNIDNAPINRVYPDAYATTSGINQYSISLNPNTCALTFNTLPGNVFTVNVKLDDGVNAVAVDFEVIVPVVESLAPQCQGTVIEGPDSITINMDISDWDSPSFSVDPLVTPANVAIIGAALPNTFGSYVRVPIIYTIPASGWETADTDGVLELRDSGGKTSQCTYSFPYRERLGVSIASDSVCPAGTGDTGCNGQAAYLTATVTGGIAPFTFIWSPFTFNASRVQAGVGVHTLKVSDGNGKVGFASYTVVANQLSLSCTQILACSSSGCVTAANKLACNIGASCGAVLYITPSDARPITASGMNRQFQVDPGVYTPRLVNAAGCAVTVSAPITIAARAPLSIAAAITRAGIVYDIQCRGGSTSVTVTPSGGCPSYRITWASTSGAPVPASANSFGSAVVFSDVVAGEFTITVQDNTRANPQGCTQTTSIVVTEPSTSASTPSYTVPQTSCNTAVSCNGGNNGRIDVSGATGTIVWTTKPAGQASVSGFNPSNLIAGVYAFQVTDNNGCPLTASGPISVTQPAPLSFTSSVSSRTCGNVQCKGSATGTITLTQVSGCGVASVQWSGGPSSPGSSLVASSLLPGTYNYLVTDVNGCTASGSATVVDVSGLALAATYTAVNPGCTAGSSGSITVTPSNGCGTSTVTWSDGFTGASRTGLTAGPYTYTVTDQNGCTVSNTVNLIAPSAPLAVSTSLQCGTLTATATGGVGSYTYSWKTNGTVNAAITGNTYPNAPVGTNTVTVTDDGSCQATSPTQTIRFPFIETGLVDATQYLPISGTWNTATPTSAVLTSTGAGLSILRTNTYAFTTNTISGRFVTPSANTNNMVGLIVGYDTSNAFYYLLEWRGTVVTATCTGTGTQAASGLYLLRVPRTATECEIAKRQNGVTLLQQSSIRTRWNAATTYNFVLAYTQNYIMLDLNGVLVVSYWFQTAEKTSGLVNPGYFGIVAGSQTGLKLENVATDAQHVSCGNTDFTVTKRFTIDTGCSPSFSVSWGDGITDSLSSNPVTLDGSNSAQISFTHGYAYSGSYVGSFCMTTGAYTICDPFNILVAEYYVPLTNFVDGMTWTQNQYYAVTYQKSASTAISRPVKMELWNAANTQKVLDVSSSSATTSQGVINYRPTTSITPAAYTLRLYWTQGEKQCPFYSSPVTMNIAAP